MNTTNVLLTNAPSTKNMARALRSATASMVIPATHTEAVRLLTTAPLMKNIHPVLRSASAIPGTLGTHMDVARSLVWLFLNIQINATQAKATKSTFATKPATESLSN